MLTNLTPAAFRTRKNQPEHGFAQMAAMKGWFATKRGWPDFLCVDDEGEFFAVETKKHTWSLLKPEQILVARMLIDHGIPCFVSDGVTIVPFSEVLHAHGLPPTDGLPY